MVASSPTRRLSHSARPGVGPLFPKNGMAAEYSLCCRGSPVGARAPGGRALGARADRVLARRRDIRIPSRLAGCEGPFDVWALARNARMLALYACSRGRPGGLTSLREALIGSSTSPPATTEHGSWLDESLPSAKGIALGTCRIAGSSYRTSAV